MIESGAREEIGPSKLAALAITLGCTLDWLVLGRGEPPSVEAVQRAVDHAHRDPKAVQRAVDAALGITPRHAPTVRTRARRPSIAKARPRARRASLPTPEAR